MFALASLRLTCVTLAALAAAFVVVLLCAPAGCALNGNIDTWNPGQVQQQASNALKLTVHVNNNLPNGTILTNTALITSPDSLPTLAVLTSTVSSAPRLTLTKSDGVPTAAAGDTLIYLLSYANTGKAPTYNVVITDRIPADVSFQGCSACTAIGGGVYSFTLNTVNARQSGVVTLSVRVNSTLPAGLRAITNTAYIRTSTTRDNPSDNTAQDTDSITTVPVMALSAAYDASTPYPGKLITYTLRYTNTSAMDTTGVVISVTRSPYVSVVPTGWSSSGGYDTRAIGSLAAGQTGTLTYVVSLSSTFTAAMNVFNNTFLIHDDGPGGLPPATQIVPTNVGVPDLFIQSVSVPTAVLPGTKFTATLTIRNGGTGRACNPNGCLSFYVDAFADPATPPPSYPYVSDGAWYAVVPPIMPGQAVTVSITNIVLTSTQRPIAYFKVDNFACPGNSCLPIGSRGGLVPESNEYNNVFGPVTVPRYVLDLPIIKKLAR